MLWSHADLARDLGISSVSLWPLFFKVLQQIASTVEKQGLAAIKHSGKRKFHPLGGDKYIKKSGKFTTGLR